MYLLTFLCFLIIPGRLSYLWHECVAFKRKNFCPSLTYAEDRKKNAQLFEEAFYGKKDLDPQLHAQEEERKVAVPEGIDPGVLAKVLANPETAALRASLAKTMGGQ